MSCLLTLSHVYTSPGNVAVSLSVQFKEPGAGADFERSKENDAGSAMDQETGVLSLPSIPTYL